MDKFKYTFPISEANIQAEFYHQCRLLGVPCVLEFITPAGRLDAAILNASLSRVLAIVECKRDGARVRPYQIARYERVGVPVHTLCSKDAAAGLAESLHREFIGRPIPDTWGVSLEAIKNIVPLKRRGGRINRRKVRYVELDPDLIIRT
jgi:hypothetical protein